MEVRASAILFGDIPPPMQAQDLYDVLESFTRKYETEEGRSYARATKEPKKVCIALFHTCSFPMSQKFILSMAFLAACCLL